MAGINFMEEESTAGWTKKTVTYVVTNKDYIYNVIKNIAYGIINKPLSQQSVDDIYSEVLIQMYKHEDYDIYKAMSNPAGTIVPIEGYLGKYIKTIVIRYLSSEYKIVKDRVKDYQLEDGEWGSTIDNITDDNSSIDVSNLFIDLDKLLREYEYIRYVYGDVYLIIYVNLITTLYKKEYKYKELLNILGISKNTLKTIEMLDSGELMLSIAKAITLTGIEESIKILEGYVYASSSIKNALMSL